MDELLVSSVGFVAANLAEQPYEGARDGAKLDMLRNICCVLQVVLGWSG